MQERDVIVDEGFLQVIECLQSRITKHSRKFVEDLVRQYEPVLAVDNGEQQLASQPLGVLVGSNEDCGVKNDLH